MNLLKNFGNLPPFRKARIPPLDNIFAAIGPGVVWMALAQGSGELIWWPYIIAKYGLTFLFLLLPACLLQYPLTYSIGYYTIVTGESIFQGFTRLNRFFALFLWMLMGVSFFWFGAFASAGGTALAALADFPDGWSRRGQTLFWAYLSMAGFLAAILLSKVIYNLIEKFMMFIAVLTVIGLVWACATPKVANVIPEFMAGLLGQRGDMPGQWDPNDATKLLTAITFAGLGGFWTLFYSYWLRDKGAGMASNMGRITGIAGKPEVIPDSGFIPLDDEEGRERLKRWKKYLLLDSGIGIFGNIFTTLMTCLLSYALLFPDGIIPKDYEIAVVQSRFFEVSWGWLGAAIFLIVAAAFLSDTWLATADAVSRIHSDAIHSLFPSARKISIRRLYYIFLGILTVITSITVLFDAPGQLILISAVIGFVGTVMFTGAIIILNHFYIPRHVPESACPGKGVFALLAVVFISYLGLAAAYICFLNY